MKLFFGRLTSAQLKVWTSQSVMHTCLQDRFYQGDGVSSLLRKSQLQIWTPSCSFQPTTFGMTRSPDHQPVSYETSSEERLVPPDNGLADILDSLFKVPPAAELELVVVTSFLTCILGRGF